MAGRRALHFVFKVADRKETARFYREVLGMKILRHEEFEEGCKASCNGPYDGKWSKSMVGYGDELSNFVLELTYNYGIGSYAHGNDFQAITVKSNNVVRQAKKVNWPMTTESGVTTLAAPGGYKFRIIEPDQGDEKDMIVAVTLTCSHLERSVHYWQNLCGMTLVSRSERSATFTFGENQARLELMKTDGDVDHATAFGRIAFSCPSSQLAGIEAGMKEAGEKILTPLISLDTPGKATVKVVILADPDGHEICFVGDEAFRELSQVDPKADDLLNEALMADKSSEWFAKKGLTKADA